MTTYPMTPALRPVSKEVHKAIGDLPSGAFNFGLYFNKWFYVAEETGQDDPWNGERTEAWICSMLDKTKLKKSKGKGQDDTCAPNFLLDNFEVSLALFNDETSYERDMVKEIKGKFKVESGRQTLNFKWDRKETKKLLLTKHEQIKKYCETLTSLGYVCLEELSEAKLISPMVIGLGDEHPTEKGFRFDWTLGVPFIPSSGLKGLVRLSYLVNALNEKLSQDEAEKFVKDMADGRLSEVAQDLFGCGEAKKRDMQKEQKAMRGKVIFLDAYPAELPRLKPEIMNCHYPDYLNKNERGPTEDQQPNPQKFWAMDAGVSFIFRILIHKDIEKHRKALVDAFIKALEEHGIGAKTSIGHGHFNQVGLTNNKPEQITQLKREPMLECWESTIVSYAKNTGEIIASYENKKAFSKDKSIVPEPLLEKLKKKSIKAKVEVEPYGNRFRLLKIVEANQ